MIGGTELSRLIQAALPLPGSKIDRGRLPSSLPALAAHNSAGGLSAAVDAVFAGTQSPSLDSARSALERTLVNHTLASSLEAAHDEQHSARNAAQPYLNAIADRSVTVEPNARHPIDLPARSAPEPAFSLNPALSLVAAELTRTLLALPNRNASASGHAGALTKKGGARTGADEMSQMVASWPTVRIVSVAAAVIASAIAVGWLVHVLLT